MKAILVVLPLACLVAPAPQGDPAKGDPAKELKQIEGEWVPQSVEIGGQERDPASVPRWTVKGERVFYTDGGKRKELSLAVDPAKEPKTVDLTDQGRPGRTGLGIYKLEGDKLTIAVAPRERPVGFRTKPGDPGMVIVYARAKAAPPAPGKKPDAASALARAAVEAYLAGFRAEDVDAVMKVSGVPFVMNDRGTVATEPALRKEFTRLFDRSDMSELTFAVREVGTLGEVKGKLGEKRHADKLKAILKDGDRVVLADADFGKRKETMSFAVTTRDGKALVVGMFD